MANYPYATFVKKFASNVLPYPVIFALKKKYYARVVKSFWEADIEPIRYLVKPGELVIDIGANVGWYTAILSQLVGNYGKVYSIEPIPDTFRLLSVVSEQLNWQNVRLFNCALSEKDGSAVMEVPLHEYGGQNFYQSRIIPGEKYGNPLKQFKVDVRSIDSLFLDQTSNFTFIKCDVEGHDLSVIKGASRFLLKSKPAWLIEVSGNPDNDGSNAEDLFNRLIEHGYTAYWFDGEKLKKRSCGDYSVNYFFLQPSHLTLLAPLLCNVP
jgi:FkbM family methyltransferase